MPYSVSVAGVVLDAAGRALVIRRRDNGHWEPPGGILEPAESIPDGVRREIREEIGLDVAPERLTGIYQNLTLGVVALVFRCRLLGGTPRTSAETTDWRWVGADEIDGLIDDRSASSPEPAPSSTAA